MIGKSHLVLICLTLLAVPLWGQLSNGQLVHYPFDGNAQDASVNGYDATEVNNPTYISNASGIANSAVLLNGTDQRIDLPATAGIRPTALPISLSFWFRITNFQNGNAKLFYSNFNTAAHQGYYCQVNGSSLELSLGDGNGLGAQNRRSFFINQNFQTNTWYHVALVVSNQVQASAWVNCQPASISTSGSASSFSYGTAPGHLGMGRQNTTTNIPEYFDGALDEFRLWDRVLTNAEVQQLCSTVCTNDTVELTVDLCKGDSILFNGQYRTQTGFYQDINTLPNGCDSISYLYLTQRDTFNKVVYDTLCANEQIEFGGQMLSTDGVYTDMGQSAYGCDSSTTLFLTASNYSDSVYFRLEGNSCAGGFLVLRAYGARDYVWNNGSKDDSIQIQYNGYYEVRGISSCGVSTFGDSVEDFCLRDYGAPPTRLFVPNAFTPNGDQLNDLFLPIGNGILQYEMSIYNRWGEKVFYSDSLELGWDGRYNGQLQPNGMYNYVLHYLISRDRYKTQKGLLYLSR